MKHPLVYTLSRFSTNGLVLVMVEGKDISLPADLSNLPDSPLGYTHESLTMCGFVKIMLVVSVIILILI